MTKFLLLYTGGGMPETEEETAAVLKAWEAWYTTLESSVVDPGYPLQLQRKVASDGTLSDDPADSMITGYTILQAESIDEAAKMAQGCPVLQSGAEVSIFQTFEVM